MTATFHVGDAIEVMGKLPENSVDLILSSPPFLALRSYLPADHPDKALEGGSQATPGEYIDWLVDVVEACDRVLAPHGSLCIELGDTYAGSGGAGGDYDKDGLREGQPVFRQNTSRYREGWVSIGVDGPHGGPRKDAYADGNAGPASKGGTGWPLAKSLSLIPELFRLTLVYGTNPLTGRQTKRWRLRNVVRWVRPNPPVGALGDKFRPATSELMVFCKSAKRYFDLDAVRSPHSEPGADRQLGGRKSPKGGDWTREEASGQNPVGAPPLDWWSIPDALSGADDMVPGTEPGSSRPPDVLGTVSEGSTPGSVAPRPYRPGRKPIEDRNPSHGWGDRGQGFENPAGAPPLDWWNIPPGGYQGAHYAVFPPELCIKPIKAMSPERVCRQCGEPSRRIVEASSDYQAIKDKSRGEWLGGEGNNFRETGGLGRIKPYSTTAEYETTGFSDCGHGDFRPGMVLDPFGGSGTTALVATGHGRDCILIDLDERNFDLALQRVGPFILERAK